MLEKQGKSAGGVFALLCCLLIVFGSVAEPALAQEQPAIGSNTVRLEISSRNVKPLNPLVYGFNSNLSKVAWRYSSPDYARGVADLRPAALRFPGGTAANFYHWNPSSPWDAGLNETTSFYLDELNAIADPKLRKSMIAARQALLRNSPSDPTISFDEFMTLCKANGIKPVIVVNVHTGTPEEAAAWVKYTVENDFEVAYWELGNELYMKRYWYDDSARARSVFRTVSPDRRNVVANATALMEDVLPDFVRAMRAASSRPIRISVTASPFDEDRPKPDDEKWDTVLSRAKYNFYDAYSVHKYIGVPFDGTPFPNRNNRPYRFDEYAHWFFNDTAHKLDALLDHYNRMYGDGREIIMTEWNYYGFAHPQYNRSVINMTHLGALFVGDRLVSMLQKGERLSLAMYHNMGSVGRWPSPLALDPASRDPRRNPWFYPFYLVGQALLGKTVLVASSVENATRISGVTGWNPGTEYAFKDRYDYAALNAVVLADSAGNTATLLTNRSGAGIALDIYIDGKPLPGPVQTRCFANSELSSTVAASRKTATLARDLAANIVSQEASGSSVQLPAYSYCLLEFSR